MSMKKLIKKIESSSSDEEEKVEEKKIEPNTETRPEKKEAVKVEEEKVEPKAETKKEEKKEEKSQEITQSKVVAEEKIEKTDAAVKSSEIAANGSNSKPKSEKETNEPAKPIEINGKKQNKTEKITSKESNKNKTESSPKKTKQVETANGTHSTNSYKIDSILMNNSTNIVSNLNGSSTPHQPQVDIHKQPVIQTQTNPLISYSHPYHMNGSYPPQGIQTQLPYGSFNNFTMINATGTAPAQIQANNHMFNSPQIGYVNSAFQSQQIPQSPYMAPQAVIQANQPMFIHTPQAQSQQPVISMPLQPQPMYILPTQPMMLPNGGSVPQFQNFYQPTDQNFHNYYQYQNVQQNP